MHSKKITAKLPKPIKVKKEKCDEDRLPQPMSHYIDDRLELVKQVFGTLKPKTIVNLAPDFLKTQELEDIQEACLNELLCISTKRLKSIITGTKCPTDTESSDDNDDEVQRQEEHVSLEEISSDSEIVGGTSKKKKKKEIAKNGNKDKTNAKTDKPKIINKVSNSEKAANNRDDRVSVLELLELQARARAIRSQLALEPVTKIEVDSDGDGGAAPKDKSLEHKSKKDKKTSHKITERKRTSSTQKSQDSSTTNAKTEEKETEQKTKKIKLKRNYRNAVSSSTQVRAETGQRVDGQGCEKDKEKNSTSLQGIVVTQSKAAQAANEDIKKERKSRSVSPDVIPIVAEPEIVLINDSSDETEDNNKTADKSAKDNKTVQEKHSEKLKSDTHTSDIEEGQLTTETSKTKENTTTELLTSSPKIIEELKENNTALQKDNNENSPNNAEKNKSQSADKSKNIDKKTSNVVDSTFADEDEDRNDDIISLGEDLEDEMNEQLENGVNASAFNEENSKASSSNKSKKKLHKENTNPEASEEVQAEDNQSWQSRYMKSSKVCKVLATSRLAKRVRDKIKKSKGAPRENVEAKKEEPVFTSKHEDGSLEQYKELLEIRNRKSK